jgi:catechol 2,3-dioxygenase-like lactoylglutathione lyase family enzyme
METVLAELRGHGVEIVEGSIEHTGAMGPMMSVYFRDRDQNLIEVPSYTSNA